MATDGNRNHINSCVFMTKFICFFVHLRSRLCLLRVVIKPIDELEQQSFPSFTVSQNPRSWKPRCFVKA
jgi:hypothetical protein